jgi:DNA-binding transcriptional ArsR family regulator
MTKIFLSPTDLVNTRFAFSPVWEGVASFRALQKPDSAAMHLAWVKQIGPQLRKMQLEPMSALITARGYMPDFLSPPPQTPYPDLESELAVIRATDHTLVRDEVTRTWAPVGEMPPAARRFLTHTDDALGELVACLRRYWDKAIKPYWPRLRALLEDDVTRRAQTLALQGAEALFSGLNSDICYAAGVLTLRCKPFPDVDAGGRGILLVPSIFVWPRVMSTLDEPWQVTLFYPPRGVGTVWANQSEVTNKSLTLLLGSSRAQILTSLRAPSTTQDLAQIHGMPPGGVSHHLKLLLAAGMASKYRDGRVVRYRLSPTGESILNVFKPSAD